MKKSELVEKIALLLQGYEDSGYKEEREYFADHIITVCEKCGMLPPERPNLRLEVSRFDTVNEWEPENE